MYDQGIGVEHNSAEAYDYFKRSASQGHSGGQYNLGIYYEQGTTPIPFISVSFLFLLALNV